MAPKPAEHYFSKHPTSKSEQHKIFESIRGQVLTLITEGGVFSPEEIDAGTKILIDNLMLPDSGPFLDLGAGYGVISIWLHKQSEQLVQMAMMEGKKRDLPVIYASEINDRAFRLLNRNIIANKCSNITVLKGDFLEHFASLKEKNVQFQAVYSNPPIKIGHDLLLDLMEKAMELLSPTGFIQYVHKKALGAQGLMAKLQTLRPDWQFKVIRKKGGYHVIVGSPVEFATKADEESDLSDYFGK